MSATHYDLDRIKSANRVRGHFFFSPATMRFFRSRVGSRVHQGPGGVYFVTSEQFNERSPRLYTVRRFDSASADIATVGEFQGYPVARQAHAEAARLAAQVAIPISC